MSKSSQQVISEMIETIAKKTPVSITEKAVLAEYAGHVAAMHSHANKAAAAKMAMPYSLRQLADVLHDDPKLQAVVVEQVAAPGKYYNGIDVNDPAVQEDARKKLGV